jgi:hypothetical protein
MKHADVSNTFKRDVVAVLARAALASAIALTSARPATAEAANAESIRAICLARGSGFVSMQGQVAENDSRGKSMQQGIARPFRMKCRIASMLNGAVYRCTSRTSDYAGLSDEDAKLLYASVQAALRAACPEITNWSQGQSAAGIEELLGATAPGQYVATASMNPLSANSEADDASVEFSIYANPITHDPLAPN